MTGLSMLVALALFFQGKSIGEPPMVTIRLDEAPVDRFLEEIARQAGVHVDVDPAARAVLERAGTTCFNIENVPAKWAVLLYFGYRSLTVTWESSRHATVTAPD